ADGWENSLRRHLLSRWESQARYPGVVTYLMGTPMMGATPDVMSNGISFFEQAGFPPRTARLAWSFALTYVHGRLSVDARLRGPGGRAAKVDGIPRRDHVAFGVE